MLIAFIFKVMSYLLVGMSNREFKKKKKVSSVITKEGVIY